MPTHALTPRNLVGTYPPHPLYTMYIIRATLFRLQIYCFFLIYASFLPLFCEQKIKIWHFSCIYAKFFVPL